MICGKHLQVAGIDPSSRAPTTTTRVTPSGPVRVLRRRPGRRWLGRHRDSVLVTGLRDSHLAFARVLTGRGRGVQRRSSVSAAVSESCRGVTSSRTRAISIPP